MRPSPSRPSRTSRIKAYQTGHRGEAVAALLLRLKLYRILARRYKTPLGEIDLIAERFGVVVFVEVKARAAASSEWATLESIKTRRIINAAAYWQARNPDKFAAPCRFDVIFLAPRQWPRHVINAFDAS